jgi:hypothetical protein
MKEKTEKKPVVKSKPVEKMDKYVPATEKKVRNNFAGNRGNTPLAR